MDKSRTENGRRDRKPVPKPRARSAGGCPSGRVDAPRHEEMRELLETGTVPSISAAAWLVVDKAYGPGSEPASKVRRLVRSYPYSQYEI